MTTATANMVSLQVYRLEKNRPDTNEFKQYTGFTDGTGLCFFGFSRIGSTWQWSIKNGGDAAGRLISQLNSKQRSGYEQVWRGDVALPTEWARDPKAHARQIQDMVESAYRNGESRAEAGNPSATAVDESPLSNLLADCRSLVSKMAVSPDDAMVEFVRLTGEVEQAKDELDTVNGYLDTLRLMIGAATA